MAYDPQRVIKKAEGEIGYHEKSTPYNLDAKTAPNDGSGNWTKYGRDMDKIPGFFNGPKSGFEWCAVWVCWLFTQCYTVEGARQLLCLPKNSLAAGCTQACDYFRSAGQFRLDPEPGDQIFFGKIGDCDHTGIVERVTAAYVYTIEGNSNNQVERRKYARSNSWIAGYGRPRWGNEKPKDDKPVEPEKPKEDRKVTVTLDYLQSGSIGKQVDRIQRLLNSLGFNCGSVDGEFGPRTEAAVKRFQNSCGIDSDGIVGPVTWDRLLGVK